jgi:hypothetical protein
VTDELPKLCDCGDVIDEFIDICDACVDDILARRARRETAE